MNRGSAPKKTQTYEGIIADVLSGNVEYLARQIRRKINSDITPQEAEALLKNLQSTIAKANREIENIGKKIAVDTKPIIVEEGDNNARKNTYS